MEAPGLGAVERTYSGLTPPPLPNPIWVSNVTHPAPPPPFPHTVDLINQGWVLLDVRPPGETEKVALLDAVNVPLFVEDTSNSFGSFMKKTAAVSTGGWWLGGTHMVPNDQFLSAVSWAFQRGEGGGGFPTPTLPLDPKLVRMISGSGQWGNMLEGGGCQGGGCGWGVQQVGHGWGMQPGKGGGWMQGAQHSAG